MYRDLSCDKSPPYQGSIPNNSSIIRLLCYERLPGRRQAGTDHLALPQSFAAFARAIDSRVPASPRLTIAELRSRDGEALLRDIRVYAPTLDAALGRYLRFGGLPAAVAEAASGAHEPSREVRRVLYDSLVREVQRRGASVPAGHALLERVVRSLGSKVSWSAMARRWTCRSIGERDGPAIRPCATTSSCWPAVTSCS
jgi:predicted AAA+ superfamily ATPase